MVNLVINLLWIEKDPDRRAEMYYDYDWLLRQQVGDVLSKRPDLLGIKGRPTLEELEESKGEIDAKAARIREKYGYKRPGSWSMISIRLMAEEVGLEDHYNYAYRQLSTIEHSDVASSLNSDRTFASPRSKNRRAPSCSLRMPKMGSARTCFWI